MKQSANPIDAVEAAYDLAASERDWLSGLARVAYPLLDGGLGVYAYRFDVTSPAQRWLDTAVSVKMATDIERSVESAIIATAESTYDADMKTAHVMPGSLSTIGEDMKREIGYTVREAGPIGQLFRSIGAVDACALRTVEPGGKGIILFALQRQARMLDGRTKRLWAKVAAHIAAARRLREVAGSSADAVLSPSGKLDHAEGDATPKVARELLRAAVQRRERARGRACREDPDGATELWRALVDGKWSLVDHFERGGRRFIVARRNEHGCTDPRALTERERVVAHLAALAKSNKLIAYELGLAESTVATHLAEAMRKLRVKSRVELLPLLARLATEE